MKGLDIKKFVICTLIAIALTLFVQVTACAQTFKVKGNTYSSVSTTSSKGKPAEKTQFTWADSKGTEYPIYISSSGSCYTIRTSKNTGKEYKSYLKPEVSEDICKKLGREYKPRKKNG